MAWLVALIGSLAGFLFGYDEGIIAGSLDLIKSHFGFSHTEVGLMTSALPFGALFGSMLVGALLASRLVTYFGRRRSLASAGILFFFGALAATFSTTGLILIISRFVLGIAIGVAAVATPLYLSETATAKMRGGMIACYQLAITIGIVCSYSVNYLLIDSNAWRTMFITSAIPALILIIGVIFLPESPRWLLSVGRRDDAISALRRLRGKEWTQESSDQEINEIETTLAKEPHNSGNWRLLFSKPLLAVLILGVMLFCLQQLSGINVVIYYAPQIFKELGFPSTSGQILATMGIGIVNVIATIYAILYIDKIGRRKLLLFGFSGTFISLALLSILSFYDVDALNYISVFCLILYIIAFAVSLGPIPYIAMAEIFPLHVRGAGMGFSSMSNWGFNGLVVFTYPLLFAQFGIEYTLGIYSVVCLLGLAFTYRYMPETKNLSLEKIEDHIMSGRPLRELGRSEGG